MQKMFNKMKEYLKNNKLYVAVMLLGIIAFSIQTKFVVLYADDLSYGVVAKNNNFVGIINFFCNHYMTWGGTTGPLMTVIFMKLGLTIWKIFSVIIMFSIVVLSVKIVNHMSKVDKGILASVMWSMIYILHIYISRDTLYWLCGHLCYVFSSFQMLVYLYFIYSRFILNNKIHKYDYIVLPFVAFCSGWTGPQMATITILIGIILLVWKKFIEKEKIPNLFIITLLFAIAGGLVELLAPGNNVRMQCFSTFASFTLMQKILYRVSSIYKIIFRLDCYGCKLGSLAFYMYVSFGLISFMSYHLSNKEKNKKINKCIKGLSILMIIFILCSSFLQLGIVNEQYIQKIGFKNLLKEYNNKTLGFNTLLPYILTSIMMIIFCILSLYISIKKKNCICFTMFTCSLIAQGIMVMAPDNSAGRTTFLSIFLLWINIVYLIQIIYEENKNNKYILDLIIIALCLLATGNWFIVTYNYRENKKIYYENVYRIEKFVENDSKEAELKLLPPKNFWYGFDTFVGIDWIEESIKEYFGINKNVKLIEEK